VRKELKSRILNLVLIGPPGSGKGTQAVRLAAAWKVPHISTGDILRRAVASGSMLGEAVKDSMSRGELVSDEIMTDLVAERLAELDAKSGFVLDGFPRTVEQAIALDVLMEERGPLAVVELTVPDDAIIERLGKRRLIEGRTDDDERVVRDRLAVYHRSTQPVIEFYRRRQTLLVVNGNLPPEEVTERITLAADPIFDQYFDSLAGRLE
jgi:adenylate kinase